jgi:hypothetical protein
VLVVLLLLLLLLLLMLMLLQLLLLLLLQLVLLLLLLLLRLRPRLASVWRAMLRDAARWRPMSVMAPLTRLRLKRWGIEGARGAGAPPCLSLEPGRRVSSLSDPQAPRALTSVEKVKTDQKQTRTKGGGWCE